MLRFANISSRATSTISTTTTTSRLVKSLSKKHADTLSNSFSTDRSMESNSNSGSSHERPHSLSSNNSKGTAPSALNDHLQASLASREQRLIRRRLPEPVSLPLQRSQKNQTSGSTSTSDVLVDFTTNDYLSLSTSPLLREKVIAKLVATPQILGSCGSRLLVNPETHVKLEERLEKFFGPGPGEDDRRGEKQVALLFNSGFDANVGFFTCIPQKGDVVVLDEYIHASVHDGVRASRVHKDDVLLFEHNSLDKLRETLQRILSPSQSGNNAERHTTRASRLYSSSSSLFVAVETLYSMDGTLAPLLEINALLNELFPAGNAYLVVDEAHATGIYGTPEKPGRGRAAEVGLDGGLGALVAGGDGYTNRILARLHTFGKALAASGAVILTTPLIRDYLINYARSLIYTTSLTHANILAAECSFDLLEDGTAQKLSNHLLALSTYFVSLMQSRLQEEGIPPSLVNLPDHLLPSPPPSLSTFSATSTSIPQSPFASSPSPSTHQSATPHILPSLSTSAFTPSPPVSYTPTSPVFLTSFLASTSLPSHPTPTPIIPLLTPYPRPLSAYLLTLGMNARPITWPTVPKGKDRVRVCLHAGNTMGSSAGDIERVVEGVVQWAKGWLQTEAKVKERSKL